MPIDKCIWFIVLILDKLNKTCHRSNILCICFHKYFVRDLFSSREPKAFSSRTTWLISTKHGTMHPWVKGITISSNVGPCPFQRGDNYEIAKKTLTKF